MGESLGGQIVELGCNRLWEGVSGLEQHRLTFNSCLLLLACSGEEARPWATVSPVGGRWGRGPGERTVLMAGVAVAGVEAGGRKLCHMLRMHSLLSLRGWVAVAPEVSAAGSSLRTAVAP